MSSSAQPSKTFGMEMETGKIRIGTRGSPLALTQTRMVREALAAVFPRIETEVVIIKTSGDWTPTDGEVRLSESEGGKGLFAREIEAALLKGEIDAAVHSMKDMDSNLPEGLAIDHMLPREDARDVLIFSGALKEKLPQGWRETERSLAEALALLPEGAAIGTASVRRSACILRQRGDLQTAVFRGNVQTRLDKLAAGQVDATLLALAGLKRLGLAGYVDVILPAADMLPAAGQGAVGIELRRVDAHLARMFDRISCAETVLRVKAERETLRVLDGSCRTPIGAHAVYADGTLYLDAEVLSFDGRERFSDRISGAVQTPQEAVSLGREIGERLKTRIPAGVFSGATNG